MKKILYIHHTAGWGGSAKSMIETIKYLDRKQYTPIVLLLKNSTLTDVFKKNNIPFHIAQSTFYNRWYQFSVHSEAGYIKWYNIFKLLQNITLWLLSRYVFAPKELKKIDFDIAHINTSVLTDWLAPCQKKAKTIIHIREPFRKGKIDCLHYFFRRQMAKHADYIIAISKDNAHRINLPEKTTVIYNFSDIPQEAVNKESYYSKTFLYLGGSSPIKGFYTLVDSLQYLNPEVKIIFAGKFSADIISGNSLKKTLYYIFSNHRKRLKAIKLIKQNPNARIVGLVSNISELLNNSCCLLSPFSKPHFSRPVIEAHLHQKMAIGSNVEGMDEIIEQNTTGILTPKDDPKKLAQAINYVAKHPYEAKRMGLNGYQVAIKKFTNKNIAQIQKVYKK